MVRLLPVLEAKAEAQRKVRHCRAKAAMFRNSKIADFAATRRPWRSAFLSVQRSS